MASKFKIINKKNLYKGFFELNEITLKYRKHNGEWSKNIKRWRSTTIRGLYDDF